jgi:hypothetical protein
MRSLALILSLPFFALVSSALADDGVKPKGSSIVYRGEIVRYDERGVTLKWGPSGQLKEFSRDQIERIDTKWPPGFEEGKAALTGGDFASAATQLRTAVREEKRTWAQDFCRSFLLQALDGQGDVEGAAEVFVDLAPHRNDVGIMAYAPFRWIKDPPLSEQRRTMARAWLLHNEEPLVKLLAANWLIDSDRPKALTALEKLLTDPDGRVRPIARAMLLREQIEKDPKAVAKEDLAEFRVEVERLPKPVRVGPQYVLGLAYEAAGDPIDAALAFLYIPFVTYGPPELQADALERAAKACRKANLKGDAAKIEAELRKKFPASAAASRVKRKTG